MVVQDKPHFRDVSQGDPGSNDRKQRLRERFEVVKKLGQGTYGKVQLAVNRESKQEVAIKTIKKAKIENEQDLVRIRREIQIMSSIHHPHIIHIYEVFENQEKIVLIMQYASGGELYDYLGCRKKLDENEARRVFRQVASAIFYCHKNRICHRDLKLENILLDDRGNAKIADFGLSNVFDERYKLKTFCGSPLYASPEIVRGTPYCGPEVDCWSLGVLLYTLVYGAMPFDGSNFKRLVKQISEGEYFEPKEKSGASGLIRRLLTVDINLRAAIRDICSDRWVNQGYDHSLLKVATDMANLTPVRLDLLLALSSPSSHAADQSVKAQTITTTQPAENKNVLCNGYYSKSHSLRAPENGASRKQIVPTANEPDVYSVHGMKDIGKQQALSAVDSAKDGLIDHKLGQEHLPLAGNKKTPATKVPATDKNESNTLIIVQDLIKDVISKVERHINISKMDLLRTTKQTQEAIPGDSCSPQIKETCQDGGGISGSIEKYEDTTNSIPEAQKSESLHTSPESGSRNSLLEQNRATAVAETENVLQDSQPRFAKNTVIEGSKMAGISNGANEADTEYFSEKTVRVQRDIFGERRKSIPNKNADLQSRKGPIQLMEPDFVIPIFNVCSNIPKRSSDLVRRPPNDSKLKDAFFRSTPIRLSDPDSKAIDCDMKSDGEQLPKGESKDAVSTSSNASTDTESKNRCKDVTPLEVASQVSTCLDEKVQRRTSVSESISDAKESPPQTEAPKLPPRKRFLIKIPKQGQSNEKDVSTIQSKADDTHKVQICDKREDKAFPEEPGTPREIEKQDLQIIEKDSVVSLVDDEEKRPSLCSEDDASLMANRTGLDAESSPKLSQRKSRRDSSKRSLSFNTKTGMNRESVRTVSEKPNCHMIKGEYPEINAGTSAKELNGSNRPNSDSHETAETLNDAAQLSEAQMDESRNIILKDAIYSCPNDEKGSSNLQYPEMSHLVKQAETLETEIENTGLLTRNESLQETEKDIRHKTNEVQNMESNICDFRDYSWAAVEQKRSKTLGRPKQRSLSRTRAMSMEFESLALMPVRIVGPPKKPPGKVEIPKTFDPTQPVTSPKAEMKEIIFIPTACVSENKEKIQKKIEKVKKAAIVIPPRRKSDAGVASRKKKYTRSKTDFIPRCDNLDMSAEDENLVMDEAQRDSMYQDAMLQSEENSSPDNMDGETVPNEMWYSAVSPDTESEECVRGDNFDGFYNESDVTTAQNHQHRHSVDTESGYWTPPEITTGERCVSQTNAKLREEKFARKYDNSEKIMLQRAAFKNSKLRMKLSDEGLDMCSLSSSLESGIYSLRQEDINGKRISPDSESALKLLSPFKFADGSYAPIARSFKKMTFPPEHSSTSELSENCSVVGDAEKNGSADSAAFRKDGRILQCTKQNGVGVDSKPIKPSDSQSSYGSNDISDDVFESWVDKEDVALTSKEKYEQLEDNANASTLKTNKTNKKGRNWQRGNTWHNYSTDKESSDNDDDLDLMVDESHQVVYGTEGLWQFLKSVNQHLSNQLKTATQKMSPKPVCHRSKSQESKHPDDVMSQRRPATRSLSREERQGKGDPQLRHFVSEGKLANADSIDCFEDTYARFNDTRYSSGYMASGSSLEDSGLTQKDFMSSVDSFHNHSDDISVYGTLRRDKYFHSSSALSSPCMTRRKKSLQNPHGSGDLSSMHDDAETIADDELSKYSAITEQKRRLSLYGTLRPKHLSQQGRAQSQILLSTDDGYQLMYNERLKKDPCSETRYGSLGTIGSSGNKASSEINVSAREHQLKDYEKILLSDLDEDALKRPLVSSGSHRNASNSDSSHHTVSDKPTSRVKKIVSDKGMRRVSFSSDVKSSKSDYHSSIRLNSLNKVREANEELLSSANHKSNVYEEEQDSGSLLEALKTYGYRGIMSQKLQSTPEKYEPPRLNYRLPTECFLSTGLNTSGWDDVEYIPVENTFAYQQPLYSPIDPMEYYHSKTSSKGSQMKRNVAEYTDLPYDDDCMFKDIFRSHRLGESDVVSRRKSVHKFQDQNDLHSAHSDRYAGENWDSKHINSTRKKSIESTATVLSNERRNSGSEKMIQRDRGRESEDAEPIASTDLSEHRMSKQSDNPIEILSEKIQALKSRCQRKSVDESRLKKELDDAEVLSNEAKDCEKTVGSDTENEKLSCYADPDETASMPENESSESVSDRIWRKSFYSRFNDVSTVRRKKSSSLLDSEYLSGHNFLRSSGRFNVDEEGGVEEPWLNTSLKRRNSNFRRSLPRQTTVRTSSLNSDEKSEYADRSSGCHKRGASVSDSECKSSFAPERKSLSQSNLEEQSTSIVCDNLLNTAKDELENADRTGKNLPNTPQNKYSPDCRVLHQGNTESSMDLNTELTNSPASSKNNLIDASPNKIPCERTESTVSRLEPDKDTDNNIPEAQRDLTNGGSTADTGISNISVPEQRNEASSAGDIASKSSAELNKVTDENLQEQRIEGNSTKCTPGEIIGTERQCDRLESDKE